MLEVTALPARQGDALWIRWGDPNAPHQMFIDMGTEPIGKKIRDRLENLHPSQRHFDLLVISHIDADHIGGVLTAVAEAEELEGLSFDEIWFNGFDHLNGKRIPPATIEPLGGVQGERLSHWLRGQAWNKAFDYGPVRRDPEGDPQVVELHDGLTLTVLGPTPIRLENLIGKWESEVRKALEKGTIDPEIVSPGIEPMGRTAGPPVLESDDDLADLANKSTTHDDAEANGSSIVLLLRYKDRSILLTGDAFSKDLVQAIEAISPGTRLALDVFKLPHHGSRNNVHQALVEAVDCKRWLFSTDGTTFKHPDPEAVARVVKFAESPVLLFNQSSEYNQYWGDGDWRERFGYSAEYGSDEDGYTWRG